MISSSSAAARHWRRRSRVERVIDERSIAFRRWTRPSCIHLDLPRLADQKDRDLRLPLRAPHYEPTYDAKPTSRGLDHKVSQPPMPARG